MSRYDPGTPNPYFAKHKYFGIPINRNIQPIEISRQRSYVKSDAKVHQGIAVELLTPEYLWATFQTEAENLLKEGGKFIEDPKARNKRINAAYAKLWLADNRFQWAGLAAFASKQVGCGLLHATEIIGRNRKERERVQQSFAQAGVSAGPATTVQIGTEAGAYNMYQRIAHANMHLFLDIYPLHRFYMERGFSEFDRYLERRQNRYPVYWDVSRKVLPFAMPFKEIRDGFGKIDAGNLKESVASLARHEQVNILQAIMYDDLTMQGLLALNQLAWATGFPNGEYQEIQLTLSAQCSTKDGITTWFSKDKYAKLWVADERMKFVLAAAERFHFLLHSPMRTQVESSIREIALSGGVA